jgi:hypothetical protein
MQKLRVLAAVAGALCAASLSVGAAMAQSEHAPAQHNAKKAAHKAAFWCPLHEAQKR